jgi:hypothetical protein
MPGREEDKKDEMTAATDPGIPGSYSIDTEYINYTYIACLSRDSSIGIEMGYWLDSRG